MTYTRAQRQAKLDALTARKALLRAKVKPTTSIEMSPQILAELRVAAKHITEIRKNDHGDFADNARISQGLQDIMQDERNTWHHMKDVQKEALQIIALKISRILSGHANNKDNWLDIEGYARLGQNACE